MTSPYPFSANAVLTADQLNSYPGLVFIKSQTIGSSVSSVTLSSVFSSSFRNYKVVTSGISGSTAATLQIAFGGASGHYATLDWSFYTGSPSTGQIQVNNGGSIPVNYVVSSPGNNGAEFTVYRPNVSSYTEVSGTGFGAGYAHTNGGTDFNVRSHTDLTLSISAGTMTGGTVRVYGYNNG
jgi:hypothetical protein